MVLAANIMTNQTRQQRKRRGGMKVRVKRWHAVAVWCWAIEEDGTCETIRHDVRAVPHLGLACFPRISVRHLPHAVRSVLPRRQVSRRRLPTRVWSVRPRATHAVRDEVARVAAKRPSRGASFTSNGMCAPLTLTHTHAHTCLFLSVQCAGNRGSFGKGR